MSDPPPLLVNVVYGCFLDVSTTINFLQTEIVKRLSAIVGQVLPFLSQEHQQQVATAVERAKQVTMAELNSVIGVSFFQFSYILSLRYVSPF